MESTHVDPRNGTRLFRMAGYAASNPTDFLIRFNKKLDNEAGPAVLSEQFLEKRLDELEALAGAWGTAYQLTLARLMELTVLCAGLYADNGCLDGVGDLLFNPRLVLVHIRGEKRPVVKERHTPLSVQFACRAKTRGGVVAWLQCNTILETIKNPLLPHLTGILEASTSRCIRNYLGSVGERARKIVELTGWLGALRLPENMDFHTWVSNLADGDRRMVESRFCRFDRALFDELGRRFVSVCKGCPDTPAPMPTKGEAYRVSA